MIKAFIFDLDGVITDTAELHFQAWQKCADQINISLDTTFNDQLKGISRMESLERILIFGQKQQDFTEEEKVKLATEKNNYYRKLLLQLTPDHLLPGIHDLLITIKKEGYKLGLASASKNAPTVLRALKIDDLFDAIADPNTVEKGKPAPDLFLKAASILEVSPAECIAIEDAKSGIEAIINAGMFSVGVGDPLYLQGADYIVKTTSDLSLKEIIDAWKVKIDK